MEREVRHYVKEENKLKMQATGTIYSSGKVPMKKKMIVNATLSMVDSYENEI